MWILASACVVGVTWLIARYFFNFSLSDGVPWVQLIVAILACAGWFITSDALGVNIFGTKKKK